MKEIRYACNLCGVIIPAGWMYAFDRPTKETECLKPSNDGYENAEVHVCKECAVAVVDRCKPDEE